AAVWWWLATPVALTRAPIDGAAKLECVSYAPFRGDQTPHDPTLIVRPEQIAEDLAELARVSKCIRTYSIDNGLDRVPELASKVGLKVLLGVWIGRDRAKNAQLADIAVSLVKDHPGTVAAVIVGSEVLLRGEMTVSDLRQIIQMHPHLFHRQRARQGARACVEGRIEGSARRLDRTRSRQERPARRHRGLTGEGSSRHGRGCHRRQRSAAARRDDGLRPAANHPDASAPIPSTTGSTGCPSLRRRSD